LDSSENNSSLFYLPTTPSYYVRVDIRGKLPRASIGRTVARSTAEIPRHERAYVFHFLPSTPVVLGPFSTYAEARVRLAEAAIFLELGPFPNILFCCRDRALKWHPLWYNQTIPLIEWAKLYL